jgi:hypothetical protein
MFLVPLKPTDAKVAKKSYPLGILYAGEFCIIIVPSYEGHKTG